MGKGFKNILFLHKAGVTSLYRIISETNVLGQFLVEEIVKDPEIFIVRSNKLKKYADELYELFNEPLGNFLNIDKFLRFEKVFDSYHAMAVFNNTIVEYLSEDLMNKYEKKLTELRVYTESIYSEAEIFFRALTNYVSQIEKRDQLSFQDLFHDEFKIYLEKNILPSATELDERYTWSGLYFDESGRYILNSTEALYIENKLFEKENNVLKKEVSGKMASPGKVRGICRVIPHPNRILEFNDGDIIITGMTRPNFVPLMKRAGAIVTDAGGILCHAAIVSRELKKPCIIGTQIATKIFKDGDIVEVDADKGIVRKI